jgi:hypothetical protein
VPEKGQEDDFLEKKSNFKKRKKKPDGANCVKTFLRARTTLGDGRFPVRSVPGSSSPSVALVEAFPECFGAFPECIWHSGKPASPIVPRPSKINIGKT